MGHVSYPIETSIMLNKSSYQKLSIFNLIEKVALDKDQRALNHLLDNLKLIQYNDTRYLFYDFLNLLYKRQFSPYINIKKNETDLNEKLELTYEKTLKQFSVLRPNKKSIKMAGPFCNAKYNRLYEQIVGINENSIGERFQYLVLSTIKFSWLESCRELNKFYERYRWRVDNEYIELYRPIKIDARDFRVWLNENINLSEFRGGDRKQNIQQLVYNHFGFQREVPFYDDYTQHEVFNQSHDPLEVNEKRYIGKFLFKIIAKEKSENFKLLRPSIRRLGKQKVKELVLKILDQFDDMKFSDASIANEYGLDKATFSRFASSKWSRDDGIDRIPDLWKNIAGVISRNPNFVDAAVTLGIKGSIDLISGTIHKKKSKRD